MASNNYPHVPKRGLETGFAHEPYSEGTPSLLSTCLAFADPAGAKKKQRTLTCSPPSRPLLRRRRVAVALCNPDGGETVRLHRRRWSVRSNCDKHDSELLHGLDRAEQRSSKVSRVTTKVTNSVPEFFMGKTLFNLKLLGVAVGNFNKIVDQKVSRIPLLPEDASVARVAVALLPESAGVLEKIGKYNRQDLGSPLSSRSVTTNFICSRGITTPRANFKEAPELFALVPETNEFFGR